MEKIASIIGRVISSTEKKGSGKEDVFQDIRDSKDIDTLWFKIVDERLRAHSYVENVRRNILFVRVDSSCYLAEGKMKKGEILSRLRAAGWGNIKNIEYRI